MDRTKIPEFKTLFNKFKQTEDYSSRVKQSAFTQIAKQIIKETLKHQPLKNEHLTGLIQMFKFNSSPDSFQKYLHQNIPDDQTREVISNKVRQLGESGFTNAGKSAILKPSSSDLIKIKEFLSQAFNVTSIQQAKILVDNFESMNIPEVKQGIYSPWLHYINPIIFPVSNNTHLDFYAWMGINRKYSACIDDFTELMKITGEPNLCNLDNFAYSFDPTDSETPPTEESIDRPTTPLKDLNRSKNIILYGPPGTGKTYHSIDMAVQIANGKLYESHQESKIQFDELRKGGQVEFITFHQNYSYEDFMVGIKPDISESSFLKFENHYGIFYKICKTAQDNYYKSFTKGQNETYVSFEDVWNEFLKEFPDKKPVFGSKTRYFVYDYNDSRLFFETEDGKRKEWQRILKEPLRGYYNNSFKFPGGYDHYYMQVIDKLNSIKAQLQKNTQEGIIKRLNYVLVIDEINRANISKVFGELITLIEDDKRLGQENELRITLPNGEPDFGVPPNLYIIGTMNTADKSIALVDIALRRRFEFIGKYPEYINLGAKESSLLQRINENIFAKKMSADYLIGHAYFMKNQPIETVLQNKVLPLLMEYFSGKTDIISSIFDGSGWSAIYDSTSYNWVIKED